jgi:hypothetical protein
MEADGQLHVLAASPGENSIHSFTTQLTSSNGCAVAQSVSRWLPTAAARVRDRAACGVCGGQSGIRAGFLRVLRFPLPIIIPPNSPSSYSPGAATVGLLVTAVPSGPNWTPPPPIPIKKKVF